MYSVREVDVKFNILHKHRGGFRGVDHPPLE